MKPKSLFSSSTFVNTVAGGILSLILIADPSVQSMLKNKQFSWLEMWRILVGVAAVGTTGYGAIVGRINAGGVYTPRLLPGPNKEDLLGTVEEIAVDGIENLVEDAVDSLTGKRRGRPKG